MSIRSIMCLFGGEGYELNALDTAFNLTRACGGRLHILHVAPSPNLYEVTREAISRSSGAGVMPAPWRTPPWPM